MSSQTRTNEVPEAKEVQALEDAKQIHLLRFWDKLDERPFENNAFKFERSIFDIMPHARHPLAMEVVREREFMPLKNREGSFSPVEVRKGMRRLHTSWIKMAGRTDEDDQNIEIPAHIALDSDEFVLHCERSSSLATEAKNSAQ